jgi:hypothetical protein
MSAKQYSPLALSRMESQDADNKRNYESSNSIPERSITIIERAKRFALYVMVQLMISTLLIALLLCIVFLLFQYNN